jgi:sugar phosphate isomerase/epimerase
VSTARRGGGAVEQLTSEELAHLEVGHHKSARHVRVVGLVHVVGGEVAREVELRPYGRGVRVYLPEDDGEVQLRLNRTSSRQLRELGYDGDITIEREIKGEKQLEDILASREYMNELLKNI